MRSILALIVASLLLGASASAEAHAPGVVLSGYGTATIDGVLSPGEWDNAGRIDFLVNVPSSDGGGTTPATLFVMNDGTTLYLGLKIARSSFGGATNPVFEFDNNHNGVGEEGDDVFGMYVGVFSPPTFFDDFRTTQPPCPSGVVCGLGDSDVGGTTDGTTGASNDGTFTYIEMSHPLDSGDALHDFSLKPGDVAGFTLYLRLFGLDPASGSYADTGFPTACVSCKDLFGDIRIAFPPSAPTPAFERVVVFGDSLSDPGNYFIAFGQTSRAPFEEVPDFPYAIGGHHFSNGPTWVEQLAHDLHMPASAKPALRAPGVFTNYAVGRARARAGAPAFPYYDLGTQVGLFLVDFGGYAPGDALYVIWIGTDDLSDALNALVSDPSGATSAGIIQAAIGAVAGNIYELWSLGGRTFLIPSLPDLAITPAIRALGPNAQFAATQLTAAYNAGLDQTLASLQGLPQIQFVRLDVGALFGEVLAAPEAAGFTNVEDPCLTFGVIKHAICEKPNRYLFWDGIHPTRAGHGVLADAARAAVTP